MKRLLLLLMLVGALGPAALAQDDKFATVQVTGVIQLPAGAQYPAKLRIDVQIARVQRGQTLNVSTIIGRQEIGVVKSTPVEFKVSAPKSYLKDAKADGFSLRAIVYDATGAKRKKVFETPVDEGLQPFTANLEPKQNLTLPVKPITPD